MIADYPWGRSYKLAILETDRSRLAGRIQTAERAIVARLQELNNDHGGTSEEQTAIRDALSGLRMLQRELSENIPEGGSGVESRGSTSQQGNPAHSWGEQE
jgi:hypothetical protein